MGTQRAATKRPRRTPHRSPWTAERIDALKAYLVQNLDAGEIARELANGISRAAVLGKMRRLRRAEPRPAAIVQPAKKRTAREGVAVISALRAPPPAEITLWRPREVPIWVREARPYEDDPSADLDIPRRQRRSLMQLNERACRWPVGDPSSPDFFFCGAPRAAGKPFCAAHCKRAYRNDQRGEGK
jgi:GcrA cell cycle regulator